MNWLPNDSSTKGASSLGGSGICRPKIVKIRTLEMPFPVIWTLNYELQFDFKKGRTQWRRGTHVFSGGQGQYFSDKPKIFPVKPKFFPHDNILNLHPPPSRRQP
jgi:hypothetical protein